MNGHGRSSSNLISVRRVPALLFLPATDPQHSTAKPAAAAAAAAGGFAGFAGFAAAAAVDGCCWLLLAAAGCCWLAAAAPPVGSCGFLWVPVSTIDLY